MRLSRLSLFREKLNFRDNCDYREAIIAISRLKDIPIYCPLPCLQPYIPSTVLCPLYGPLSPLQPYVSLRPYVFSTVLCPLYGTLPSLRPSAPSTALYSVSSLLFPLQPSIPYPVFCSLYSPMSLYDPMSSLRYCASPPPPSPGIPAGKERGLNLEGGESPPPPSPGIPAARGGFPLNCCSWEGGLNLEGGESPPPPSPGIPAGKERGLNFQVNPDPLGLSRAKYTSEWTRLY
jgi:hypothetical protein